MKVKRLPVDDELSIDGELVVLVDDKVLVLSEVASEALHRLVTAVWTTAEALTAHLEVSIGLPAEGHAAVLSLVSTLEQAGLVAVEH